MRQIPWMKTILLIDDDQECREPAAELLRRQDWRVLEAGDGEQGLELAVRHRPDIILCDLLMPRVNGYQVCRAVREHLELRHTRIIVVTGRDYASDRKSAEEAGADGYIVKPLDVAKLEKLLGKLDKDASKKAEIAAPTSPSPQAAAEDGEGTYLKFWGVRGSIPSPGSSTVFFGGNTACVEVRVGGKIIILDAGSGIRPLGVALVDEAKGQPLNLTVLITHTHWDHIQGFPFFVPAYDGRNRINIFGYEGARSGLATALAGQMESPYFPVALDDMPGNLRIDELREMEFEICGVRVESCFTNHPGVCVAYKLHTQDGTIVFMPDNETKRGSINTADGSTKPDPSEAHIAEFIHGVDVLVMDSQYTAEEYQTHVNWGHGCIDEVVRLAVSSEVKRLYMFHHDPGHDDRFLSSMLMHARQLVERAGSSLLVEAAEKGWRWRYAPA
jgi:phosphoribosyl 1,2-cyclic phosphodiesterase/ActR/RegA family two-component response regulator